MSVAEQAASIERALLGSTLVEPKLFRLIEISADDLSLSSHRTIFRAMAALDGDGKRIDQVLLVHYLEERGELEAIGGAAYIAGLFDDCVPESAQEYASIITTNANRRRLLSGLEIAKSKALEGHGLDQIVADLQQQCAGHSAGGDILGHTYEETMNAPDIRFAIDGFLQEQGITLIGGLSGHGKTLIMLAMVRALLEGGELFHRFAVNAPATKVIYLIPEGGLSPFVKRLKLFRLTDYVRDGRLTYRTLSKKPICLNDPLLLRQAEGADIFLDTAVRFKDGDENGAAENNKFAEALFSLQRAGARTITGAHHAPKSFAKDTFITLEGVLRGTGDIGAMLCTCWGIRQIDAERNRIYVQNVKPRDFQPCAPFIIQGRPSLNETGYFELTEPPEFAGELSDHLSRADKGGRPAKVDQSKTVEAHRLHDEGKSYRQIAQSLEVSVGTVSKLLKTAEETR